uniref:RNA-binding protein n=1 Tax=Desulfobacca acetoxidans TaxID=60893 RepID=A0A7V4GAG9_9BACT
MAASRCRRKGKAMQKRLAVGNLPHHMTEAELETLFSEAGLVDYVKIIPYLHNGETRGFGFVAMNSQAAGHQAMALFDGRLLDGLPLIVRAEGRGSKYFFGRRARP